MRPFRLLRFAIPLFLLTNVPASAAETWIGETVFRSVAGASCAADGWGVGSNFTSAFTPSGIEDNGPESYLSFLYRNRSAYSLSASGRFAAGKAYRGSGISSRGKYSGLAGATNQFNMSPATVTAATNYIHITGVITNWAGNAGCFVTFDGAFLRRP